MKPAPFAYHRAHSVAEAVALLTELGDEAKILAGGLSLVPMMNFRLARPTALVDVSRIGGLSYLRADAADGLRIGALTTHRAVEISRDPAVLGGFGVLPRSARWIGHYPIRSRGTFGGSIAHADPASEWCMLAVLLDAQVVLTGPDGRRTVPAAEFFEGYYSTAAGPDEMITELWFPQARAEGGAHRVRPAAGRLRGRRGRRIRGHRGRRLPPGPRGPGRCRPAAGRGGRGPAERAARHRGNLAGHGGACRPPDRPRPTTRTATPRSGAG